MPYIHTRASVGISKDAEQTMKQALGQAIALLPGKSESWLMVDFEDNCRLHFRGESAIPAAFVCVKLFGQAGASACEKLTAAITDMLEKTLAIPPENVYVQYESVAIWGWRGANL